MNELSEIHVALGDPYEITEYRNIDSPVWIRMPTTKTIETRTRIVQRMQTTYPDGKVGVWIKDITEEGK